VVHPLSVRFRDPDVLRRLKVEAGESGGSSSALAEQLIDEGLRMRRHPLITFRDGPTGRRAAVIGGPDVWEVVGAIVGGDISVADRLDRAAEELGLRAEQVDAAMAYYAEFSDEIDERIRSNAAAAEQAEALWRRRRDLLAR
jgi:hypothetical protein